MYFRLHNAIHSEPSLPFLYPQASRDSFLSSGLDNLCLPGYQLIGSLLTSSLVADELQRCAKYCNRPDFVPLCSGTSFTCRASANKLCQVCVIYIPYLANIYYSAYHIRHSLFVPAPHVNKVRNLVYYFAHCCLHIAVKYSQLISLLEFTYLLLAGHVVYS
jgi:hypothetical protein